MRLAVSHDAKNFGEPKIIPTPQDFEEAMQLFAKLARELSSGEKIEVAAGGVAGAHNKEKSALVTSPNLPAWVGKPLRKRIEEIVAAPVLINNDVAIIGLGEAIYGAGRGYGIVAYITVSTGTNGVRIVDGRIDKNATGFETGHQIINADNTPATLESYIGGAFVEKRFGKKPKEITDPKVWDELARWLAIGLNNTIVHWSPEAVVLGGAMVVGKPGISIETVKRHLGGIETFPFTEPPEIKQAELGNVGGLWGGLALIRQKFKI